MAREVQTLDELSLGLSYGVLTLPLLPLGLALLLGVALELDGVGAPGLLLGVVLLLGLALGLPPTLLSGVVEERQQSTSFQ
jgi:hypothetical protein